MSVSVTLPSFLRGTGRNGPARPALITGPEPARGCGGAVKAPQPGDTCLFLGWDTDKAPGLHREQTPVFEETGVLQQTESQPVCSGNIHGPGSKSNSFIVCLDTQHNHEIATPCSANCNKVPWPCQGRDTAKELRGKTWGLRAVYSGRDTSAVCSEQHRSRPWGKQESTTFRGSKRHQKSQIPALLSLEGRH